MAQNASLMLALLLCSGCPVDADEVALAIQSSLAAGDTRLYVRAGRDEELLGIERAAQAQAKLRCGTRYLDGLGDVIRPEDKANSERIADFAYRYNQQMVHHCR